MEEAENDEDAIRDMLSTPEIHPETDVEEDGVDGGEKSCCVVDGTETARDGSTTKKGAVDEEKENTSVPTAVEWLWEAELNPSRSLRERELEFDSGAYLERGKAFMGENCGWQCLWASAKKQKNSASKQPLLVHHC